MILSEVIEETLVEEVFETLTLKEEVELTYQPNTNSGDISVYLELLNDWKKLAIGELVTILDDYGQTTKKVNLLQQKNASWLQLEYSIDPTYDIDDEFSSKFELLKADFLKKAIEMDIKATEKKLIFLGKFLQDPNLIFQKIYKQQILPKIKNIPHNLKESWDSAIKRCEYAYSQDAMELLEKKLKEIETTNKVTTNSLSTKPNINNNVNKNNNINNKNNNTNIMSQTNANKSNSNHISVSGNDSKPVINRVNNSTSHHVLNSQPNVNDRNRPSTRGRSQARRGVSDNDFANILTSLSNI